MSVLAGTWYAEALPTVQFAAMVGLVLVVVFARKIWRTHALALRVVAGIAAVGMGTAWLLVGTSGHGRPLATALWPWDDPPKTIALRCSEDQDCLFYGHESGTPDPREVGCRSEERMRGRGWHDLDGQLRQVGYVRGLFGGPGVFTDSANPGAWLFIRVKPDCYIAYPPWI